MKCPYCGTNELGTGDINGICTPCANKYNLKTFTGLSENKCDTCIKKRRREAAEEVIKYMSESGMSIVPWNEVYKSWQSIKKEAGE